MSKPSSGSIGEMMFEVRNRMEIEARQQSYGAATAIVQNVITRFGNHESKPLVQYWTEVADGIFNKINKDMQDMTTRK
jgi:hypothetical protein